MIGRFKAIPPGNLALAAAPLVLLIGVSRWGSPVSILAIVLLALTLLLLARGVLVRGK